MFIIFNKSVFFIILNSIVFVCASHEQQVKSDQMCGTTESVLCVKHVLKRIATVGNNISRTATEIEKNILSKTEHIRTLDRSVYNELASIDSHLPTLQYHKKFFELNNVDKKYFGDLLLEAHNAMSFYYNSIEDVLNMNDIFSPTAGSLFRQIKYNLKNDIICQYRSILYVYSYEWPSINESNRIQFSRGTYRKAPSLIHDTHSIIIARLLRESMQMIHSVINNLEAKFF